MIIKLWAYGSSFREVPTVFKKSILNSLREHRHMTDYVKLRELIGDEVVYECRCITPPTP